MSRILIVDDESSIRQSLAALLARDGYEAAAVPDADAALRELASSSYDVVLTDIIMPRATGLELLEAIRTLGLRVQILVMTGEPTVDSAVRAVHAGANDYLRKPIDREELRRVVARAAEMKALQDRQLALEAERTRYREELERTVEVRTESLRQALAGAVSLIASAVEVRDPYTAGHQRKVGNLAAAIAAEMGLDERSAESLRVCGYLHDVGKLGVPAEILVKPTRLSAIEMDLIRGHAEKGYEMLRTVDFPGGIAETVRQHHERLDGSGYPHGVRADRIPLPSRVLAVADVVEAMISHRPYRPARGLDVALAEIREGAGTRFDADVVAACVRLFRERAYALDDRAYAFRAFEID